MNKHNGKDLAQLDKESKEAWGRVDEEDLRESVVAFTTSHDKKYNWICNIHYIGDKLVSQVRVSNDCRTLKELRRWWRKEGFTTKLIGAVNTNKKQ
jgi:hypothetical protein